MSSTSLSGSNLNDCAFEGVQFTETRFDNVKVNDCLWRKCRLVRVTLKNIDLSDARLERLEIADKVIDGNDAFNAILSAAGQG